MAHSFDSTLLQRMGFKDSDRQTSEHDIACISIASRPRLILDALGISAAARRPARALLEQPLQKGDGKYASTVGFIDAIIEYAVFQCDIDDGWREVKQITRSCAECGAIEISNTRPGQTCCDKYMERTHETFTKQGPPDAYHSMCAVLVEVKTRLDNIGDLLRQMNLYREYKKNHERAHISHYVVWSLDDGDGAHPDLLSGQGYELVVGKVPRRANGEAK